ncbi:MAG: hypothetical protein QNJ00_12775 [Woeseiaceae bacterium]|nr:hypothetical protein [Woeseiaceae bacterium]
MAGSRLLVSIAAMLGALSGCGTSVADENPPRGLVYEIEYRLTPDPLSQTIGVTMSVSQPRHLLREVRFAAPAERLFDVAGDGELDIDDGRLSWRPPESGGMLSWTVEVPHRRNGNGHDAWLDERWGLLRAEDVVPRAATRTLKGAHSDTTVVFELPDDWSVITQYRESDGRFDIANGGRRFVQPSGWIVMGELGVRRERVTGVRVAVAAPEGEGVRRMDMIALSNWLLPELGRIVPELPDRVTIVSAGDPMWRGGLSAPASIFIHADRPLLSENGTSTLVHELMHVAFRIDSVRGHDWIVEGLAEYYTLELLRRSGTLSERRFERALASQRDWATDAKTLCAPSSTGATTALAVSLFVDLDAEISSRSQGEHGLDDVLEALIALDRPLDLESLRNISSRLIGTNPDALHIDRLPGCRTLSAGAESAN